MGSQGFGYSSRGSGCNRSIGVSATPEKPRFRPNALCVVPCTVSQLHSATEIQSGFSMGEIEINMVSLVGIVRRVSSSMSSMLYLLDDMTGAPIGARFWLDGEEDGVENSAIPPGTYVKIIGRLRSFENHRSVVGLHIRRLQDLNEITSHILEVTQAHMAYGNPPLHKTNNTSISYIGTEQHQSVKNVEGFSPAQNEVFKLIKSYPDPSGISLKILSNCVTPQYLFNIKNCLQFLTNEGHIYTTVDDDHFKAVD
ncbi:replication protein A 32 kDa subunit-like isoform X1 [Alosa sapidissima]|uniref:replication protein A 32 kDa subunit-like isoform X1 n=1 Tax=Alosa sapidissima TaxID=34773 RepID=UPI001C098FA8|nr:replication protein A 32 kDa subunit-like isoform X1 [Alosa sapidissima]